MNKLVTIDLWQTIMGESDFSAFSPNRRKLKCEAIYDYLKKFHNDLVYEDVESSHDYVVSLIAKYSRFHSDLLFKEWLILLIKKIDINNKINLNSQQIKNLGNIIDEIFISYPPDIFEGTSDFLDYLRGNDYKVGIISNTGLLKKNNIFFDVLSLSNELGIAKPNSKIFTQTLGKVNIEPAHSIHIGDNPVADVLGAINIGMDAILISKAGRTKPVNNKVHQVIDNIGLAKESILSWSEKFPKRKY
ncbi:MAG: hypothetical protein EGP09_02995 [SAR202 cluster bacterium]|nr:MAG: hypothetical protein EGP09_02995 [SAR202 cluster bacterium]